MSDRLLIRELIENWVLWRDSGNWERFRGVWHSDGRMMATWFQGTGDQFIEANKEGWARGVSILHFLGGTSIDIVGERAVAQTKMTISQRGHVEGCSAMLSAPAGSMTFLKDVRIAGGSSFVSRYTKRTGLIRSTRARSCNWTPAC